jgi:hypothetical protein
MCSASGCPSLSLSAGIRSRQRLSRFVVRQSRSARSRDLREHAKACPLTLPSPPTQKRVRGEGEIAGTGPRVARGGTAVPSSCPRLPWANVSRPFRALWEEVAASCRCTSQIMSNLHWQRHPAAVRLEAFSTLAPEPDFTLMRHRRRYVGLLDFCGAGSLYLAIPLFWGSRSFGEVGRLKRPWV